MNIKLNCGEWTPLNVFAMHLYVKQVFFCTLFLSIPFKSYLWKSYVINLFHANNFGHIKITLKSGCEEEENTKRTSKKVDFFLCWVVFVQNPFDLMMVSQKILNSKSKKNRKENTQCYVCTKKIIHTRLIFIHLLWTFFSLEPLCAVLWCEWCLRQSYEYLLTLYVKRSDFKQCTHTSKQ